MLRVLCLAGVATFLGPINTCLAQPEPLINFSIKHYEVTGSTTAEISQSIFRNTPVQINGRSYGAVTHNRFSTSYSSVRMSNGGCAVKNARLVLDSVIILPKLVVDGQSQLVLDEWGRYIGALRAHEMMHANNGKYTAQTLASRLYNFKSTLSCPEMKLRLDRAVDGLINNMGEWDQQLDAKTEHGKSQGAFLRPGFR